MLEYNIGLIEREVDELIPSQEDDKNVQNLFELNSKVGMNDDIFRILYGNVVSADGQRKYASIMKIKK